MTTLSSAPAYAPGFDESRDALLFKFDKIASSIAEKVKNAPQKILRLIRNKREEGVSFLEIRNKLSPEMQAIFDSFIPTDQDVNREMERAALVVPKVAQLDAKKKDAVAKSLGAIEEKGFLPEVWEKIQSSVGFVVDGALSILQSIPSKYVVVAGALLLLTGGITAALAFLSFGEGVAGTATFGALQSLIPIDPDTFGSMIEPLRSLLSGSHAGLPS